MMSQIRTLLRHGRNVAQVTTGMLMPTRKALELGVRCRMTNLDIQLPIPSIYIKDMFPEGAPDPANGVRILPGVNMSGSPNVFDEFLLSALVKRIQPQTIFEIGTFKGGTTWHFYQNAPPDAVIYTMDLPDDEVPEDSTEVFRQYQENKRRPFLPKSERIRQIKVDSRKWDGKLDRKVQFAFIDGDHSYEVIRNDTEKTLPLLDSYGCICWHDSLEDDFGFGSMRYLVELSRKGHKIFRIRSIHEISSLTILMTDVMLERLNIPQPRSGPMLFRDYVGRD